MANEYWDEQWNPVRGCTKCSPACENCYAESMAKRFWRQWRQPAPPDHFKVTIHPEMLTGKRSPIHWTKPRNIFVGNTCDIFHDEVPDDYLDKMFAVMAACPQHTFRVLTKRAERMREYVMGLGSGLMQDQSHPDYQKDRLRQFIHGACCWLAEQVGAGTFPSPLRAPWPLPNVWLGVSVWDQESADRNIPILLQTPAAVRWVSYEPALGPVDLAQSLARLYTGGGVKTIMAGNTLMPRIDWLVLGGETGPHARPCDPRWLIDAALQCKAAGVPVWFKQWGRCPADPIPWMARETNKDWLESCQQKPEVTK